MVSGDENDIYESGYKSAAIKRGRDLLPFREAKYSGSLMLGNSHVSLGQAIRLPQNYIPIAGYHIDDNTAPLPEVIDHDAILVIARYVIQFFVFVTLLCYVCSRKNERV